MADVWRVYDGSDPAPGGPLASLSLDDAIQALQLKPEHYVSDDPPRFGARDRDLWFSGYRHVVVEVRPNEGRLPDWKPGFYKSPLAPKETVNRLLRYVLAPILGESSIVRIEHLDHMDSLGRNSLMVMVVLAPDALGNLSGETNLKAVSCLQNLLQGMEGTPLLEYATEAELALSDE